MVSRNVPEKRFLDKLEMTGKVFEMAEQCFVQCSGMRVRTSG